MKREELDAMKRKIETYKADHQMVENLGGFSTETQQSDKIGFDWVCYYLGDVLVKKEYVEQENPCGTADNPIVWVSGMVVIPNAYYTHDDTRKVWMGEEGATPTSYNDENFVEF